MGVAAYFLGASMLLNAVLAVNLIAAAKGWKKAIEDMEELGALAEKIENRWRKVSDE